MADVQGDAGSDGTAAAGGNVEWAAAFVDGLVSGGLGHACIAPGSRSAPLALALAATGPITTTIHVDERSAAFFALGYAKATGRPAAALCTSGTAAANFLPAIVEADMSRTPLVALTADRPPELRDTGAWQAIDQLKLYGGHVRWFAEVAAPGGDAAMLRYVGSLGVRAAATAAGDPPGPVHLNFPFREPLTPKRARGAAPDHGAAPRSSPGAPAVSWTPRPAAEAVIQDLARRVAASPRGLIVAGPQGPRPGMGRSLARLAAATGYPVLADASSNVRFGDHDLTGVLAGGDAYLRCQGWVATHRPQVVLRFGASLTWKYAAQFLNAAGDTFQVVVDPHATWDDPTRRARLRVMADPVLVADALAEALAGPGTCGAPGDAAWRQGWQEADAAVAESVAVAAAAARATSPWVYPAALAAMPAGGLVCAANSMAVRDLDSFSRPMAKELTVVVNRGAAGIDGTLSTALGAGHGAGAPTVLFTGDLAFLHDINGLTAARTPGLRVAVVLVNDGGGGIFAYLDVAGRPEFEALFRADPGVRVADLCRGYGVAHEVVENDAALGAALEAVYAAGGVRVLEVPVDVGANTACHRAHWDRVARAVAG